MKRNVMEVSVKESEARFLFILINSHGFVHLCVLLNE